MESVTDIDRDSHLLFLMSKTYSDVSKEYMIDQIAGLAGALSIQSNDERDIYVKDMANKSKTISNQVKDLATERHKEYEMTNLFRQEQYMQYIQEGMLQELNNLGGMGIGRR